MDIEFEPLMYLNPEVAVSKGMTRAGFEIMFKFLGLVNSFKGYVELDSAWCSERSEEEIIF